MKKNILIYNIMLTLVAILIGNPIIARSTSPHIFSGNLPVVTLVSSNGGTTNANIDANTGALDTTINPRFNISSNNGSGSNLTQSWTCNTSGITQNAIFTINTQPYLILTNIDVLPPDSAISDIKTGTPTAMNNPNAIAYAINTPPDVAGKMQVTFISTTNSWSLHLAQNGSLTTSQTIPAETPLANTFSYYDEPGMYQATVTLSFNP